MELPESWNDQKSQVRLKKSKRPESHSLIIGWKTDLSIMYRLYFVDFLFVCRFCALTVAHYEIVKRQKNPAPALAHCSRNCTYNVSARDGNGNASKKRRRQNYYTNKPGSTGSETKNGQTFCHLLNPSHLSSDTSVTLTLSDFDTVSAHTVVIQYQRTNKIRYKETSFYLLVHVLPSSITYMQ